MKSFRFSQLFCFALLIALSTLLPITAFGQITGNTGTLGNGTNVTNSAYRDWITVYSYVKNYELSGEILKETRWYDGISVGMSPAPPYISLDLDLAAIGDRIQPRANDTINGKITSVEDVTLTNERNATIGNAYIAGIGTVGGKMAAGSAGIATLNNDGVIHNAFVDSYGYVNNRNDSLIGNALVYDGGELINSGQAKITDAVILGGLLQNNGGNALGYTTPTIEKLAIRGGKVENRGEARIETALLDEGIGILNNFDQATIGTVSVTGGTLYYGKGGTGGIGGTGGTGGTGRDAGWNKDATQGGEGTPGNHADIVSSGGITTTEGINYANIAANGTMYNGIGGDGGKGGVGGTGGKGSKGEEGLGARDGGAGGKGGVGGDGSKGTQGFGKIATVDVFGTLYNGAGGTGGIGGNGGTGGNGGDSGGLNSHGGTGGTGGEGGNGEGRAETVNVKGGTVFNGSTGANGGSGDQGSAGSGESGNDGWKGKGGTGGNGGTGGTGGSGFGFITTLNLESGFVHNGYDGGTGQITTANINGGTLFNGYDGGTGQITTAVLNGGTLLNRGRIDEMTYTGGSYYGNGTLGDFSVGNGYGIGNLQIGDGGALGNIQISNIVNNAAVTFNHADDYYYSGDIFGTGSLTKSGTGTLTLVGLGASGDVTVNAGTLQFYDGYGVYGILGNIVNNANVTFNYADHHFYEGTISGTGSLTKSGTGELSLYRAINLTGDTVVNDGTLSFWAGGNTLNNVTVSGNGKINAGYGYDNHFGTLSVDTMDNIEYLRGATVNSLTVNHVTADQQLYVSNSQLDDGSWRYSDNNFGSFSFNDIKGYVNATEANIVSATVNDNGAFHSVNSSVGTATVNDNGKIYGYGSHFGTLSFDTVDNIGDFMMTTVDSLTVNHVTADQRLSVSNSSLNWYGDHSNNFGSFSFSDIKGYVDANEANIVSATVNDNGAFSGYGNGVMNTATVSGNGIFKNYNGTVNTATVSDNGSFSGTATTATVSGNGTFENNGYGTVNMMNTATVSGSEPF